MESDIKAILKRVDIDRDGRVALYEFRKFLSGNVPLIETKPDYLNNSLSRSTLSQSKSSRGFESPLRTSVRSLSPRRELSPLRTTLSPNRSTMRSPLTSQRFTSPQRDLQLSQTFNRFEKSPLGRSYNESLNRSTSVSGFSKSNGFKTSSYTSLEDETFLTFMKEIMNEERNIERLKTDLALRSDFTIEDAFRIFELEGRGYVTDLDIKYGMNALDLFPTNEEVSLLVKRYDSRKTGILK